ncbi:flagellar basal-body rod protein FlgF [Opitutales bacterium ASA1]|uniref:flagellar hook-basal body protein n=1 Tax=Congregicoccus parvus TaxID=3081749 RepID=UPI002B2AE237|nr:flagellar basal-body rod protein FlgF [Opitutales bacterium ASA1]
MIQGLYQSAAAADGLQAWNDAIARNIASSSMPGYKKSEVSFEGVMAGAIGYGVGATDAASHARLNPQVSAAIDFSAGEMRRTGDPMEFAIEGDGFFRLQRPDGSFVFTRDGQFRLAADGRLVSKQGYEVTSDAGAIQLLIDGGPLSVDAEGRLRQGDQEVGVLGVFGFGDRAGLRRTTGGFEVDPENPQAAVLAEGARVHQGVVEMGNVSGIREMTHLVLVSNALQANQKVIQSFDGLSERAVQILGNTGS